MSNRGFLDPSLDLLKARDAAGTLDLAVDHQSGSAENIVSHDLLDVGDLLDVRGDLELGQGVDGPFLNFMTSRAARPEDPDFHVRPPWGLSVSVRFRIPHRSPGLSGGAAGRDAARRPHPQPPGARRPRNAKRYRPTVRTFAPSSSAPKIR